MGLLKVLIPLPGITESSPVESIFFGDAPPLPPKGVGVACARVVEPLGSVALVGRSGQRVELARRMGKRPPEAGGQGEEPDDAGPIRRFESQGGRRVPDGSARPEFS